MAVLSPLFACAGIGGQTGGGEEIIDHGTPSEFLACDQPEARVDTVIGPRGGLVRAGATELLIPRDALSGNRRIVLRHELDRRVSVTIDGVDDRIPPEPFRRSATLRINVSGCSADALANPRGWWIWRMNSVEGMSQKLRTRVNRRHAVTQIDSTSKFMIAN
jgi:hypothetical protein